MDILPLSIVIPTLNEESYIGKLLDSIAAQKRGVKEVIVVDAHSTDQTIQEIKKRSAKLTNLRYYQIPRYTVARQRNFGVKKTTSDHIFFLDADVFLQRSDLLDKYWKKIVYKKPDIATARNSASTEKEIDKAIYYFAHYFMKLSRLVWPIAVAINMYVNKTKFMQVGGFDEEIRVGEDTELIQRMIKKGYKYSIFDNIKISSSVRRLNKEGRVKYGLKLLLSAFYAQKYGFRRNPIKYEFGKHSS